MPSVSIVVALVAASAFLARPASAAEPAPLPPIRVGIESGARPLSFVGDDGRPVGYSVDLVEAIAREAGFTVVFVQAPWDVIFERFKSREIDALASLAYTPERDRFIDYSVPHLRLKGSAFLRADSPPLRRAEDLAGLRIAVQRDSFSHEFLRRRGFDRNLLFTGTLPEAIRAVSDRRVDAVLAVGLVGQKIIADEEIHGLVASDLAIPELDFNLHLGVHTGDSDLLARANAGLARLRENRTYDRIYEKWIGPYEARALRLTDLRRYALPALAVLVAVVAAFLWQRRLLSRVRDQALALEESQSRLRLVLAIGDHGLWDYDFARRASREDAWRQKLTGVSPAELSADPSSLRKRIHPDDLAQFAASDALLAAGQDEIAHDYRLLSPTGEWRWVSSRGRVIARGPDGAPLRAVGTNTDITLLKRRETERAELQAKMLEAQKLESLGVLAGGIAHDFNNLLAVILGNSNLVRLDLRPGQSAAAECLAQIETASQRAADLCRQMLAYAGHGGIARERLSLGELVTDTTDLLRLSIGKHIVASFALDPATPWVEADRSQLRQIVMNLVINAAEAIAPPAGTLRLSTGGGRIELPDLVEAVHRPEKIAAEFAWLEVADSGCGMTPETRAKIFEPFFTTKFTGRGLGLAAVLGIVRSHEGVFVVRSTPGVGSVFRIYLPAVAAPGNHRPPLS